MHINNGQFLAWVLDIIPNNITHLHLANYKLESESIHSAFDKIISFPSLNFLGLRDIRLKDNDVKIIAKFIDFSGVGNVCMYNRMLS